MDQNQSESQHPQKEPVLHIIGTPGKEPGQRGGGYLIRFKGQNKYHPREPFETLTVIAADVRGRTNRDLRSDETARKLSKRTQKGVAKGISTDTLEKRVEKINDSLGEKVITWLGETLVFNLEDETIVYEIKHLIDHIIETIPEVIQRMLERESEAGAT